MFPPSGNSELAIFFITAFFLIDYINPLLLKFQNKLKINRLFRNEDYTIVIPIFGKPTYLEGLKSIRKYGNKVMLLTTDSESDEFDKAITEEASTYGYQIVNVPYSEFDSKKKSSISLIKLGVKYVKTKYMIRMDADSIPSEDLAILFGNLERLNLDLASVRVLPLKQQSGKLIYDIQHFEYENAMDIRILYPYMTSGAALCAKTEVFRAVMPKHTCIIEGEDIEFGKLAWNEGYNIAYLPFVIYTEVPSTYKSLIKQRTDWLAGEFRHSVINWNTNHLFNFFYYAIVVYLLAPIRLYITITNFALFPIIYVSYVLLTCLFYFNRISWYVFVYPLYSFIQASILPFASIYEYFKNISIYRKYGKFETKLFLSRTNNQRRYSIADKI